MWGPLRRSPLQTAAIILFCVVTRTVAVEPSVSGSVLHIGGGTDAVDAPLVIPRFFEAEAAVRLDGKLDDDIWTQVPAYAGTSSPNPKADGGSTG